MSLPPDDVTDILSRDFPEVAEIDNEEILAEIFRPKRRTHDVDEDQVDNIIELMQERTIE